MSDADELEPVVRQPVSTKRIHFCRILAYGIGHFHNDMCASMWFTYLLIFTTKVLGFSSSVAGNLILIGQITDAICTPLVGFESDRTDIHPFCLKYGRRKIWHLIGFICVTCSFAFLFVECFGCIYQKTSEFVELFYYVPFVVVFQFGWACVQISHLALIPELSTCQHERATLNGVRYAFTVLANMAVFALVYFFIGLVDASHKSVTHNDGPSFSYVAIAVTVLGCLFSTIFHIGTKEVEHSKLMAKHRSSESLNQEQADSLNDDFDSNLKRTHMRWSDWFNVFDFYLIAVLYMATRIFGNVAQAYLPLYVLETQHFEKTYIAIIPMVVYLSSFVTSSILSFQAVSRFIPRKVILLFGVFLGVGSCVWMWFHELHTMVYAVSVLLGMASTILLVVSLALIADLINDNTESGAFVYGSMSFMDKISTGIAIQIVQSLQPNCINMPCINLDYYFRGVMVYVPGAALVVIFCSLMIVWPRNIGERKNNNDSAQSIDSIENGPPSANRTPDEDALLG